jgi:hypothetical protein
MKLVFSSRFQPKIAVLCFVMRVTTRGWHFLKPSHRATSCMGATESIVLWPCFPLLDYPHHSQTCRPTRFAVVVATSAFAFRCSSHRRTCALPGRRARYRIAGIASSQRDSRFAAAELNAAQNFLSCGWTLSSGRSRQLHRRPPPPRMPTRS